MIPVLHRHLCDKCDDIETQVVHISKTTPKTVLNRCPKCKTEYVLNEVYPQYKFLFAKYFVNHPFIQDLETWLNTRPNNRSDLTDKDIPQILNHTDNLDEAYIKDNILTEDDFID